VSVKLKQSPQIWKLATDLGLKPKDDALAEIVKFCAKRIRAMLAEFMCDDLSGLLLAAAAKLDTVFIEVRSDDDIASVRRQFIDRGEVAFVNLESQLAPDVFAITYSLLKARRGDRQFVSIIDCRGEKAWRTYFSKWHELAHLLTLTPQTRLKFCRTHCVAEQKDPEEAAMDVIAGAVGFLPELIRKHATGGISFDKVLQLREKLCPEASFQASLIGITSSWPTPTLLIQPGLGLRKREQIRADQNSFGFRDKPEPVLRALSVGSNEAAKAVGLQVHRNMRVPETSVIHKVFSGEANHLKTAEDLAWWKASDGSSLSPTTVFVEAKRFGEEIYALVTLGAS
jgi:hypothetical protein